MTLEHCKSPVLESLEPPYKTDSPVKYWLWDWHQISGAPGEFHSRLCSVKMGSLLSLTSSCSISSEDQRRSPPLRGRLGWDHTCKTVINENWQSVSIPILTNTLNCYCGLELIRGVKDHTNTMYGYLKSTNCRLVVLVYKPVWNTKSQRIQVWLRVMNLTTETYTRCQDISYNDIIWHCWSEQETFYSLMVAPSWS